MILFQNKKFNLFNIISPILLLSALDSEINYSEDISSIIYNNCTECHRANEIGAFLPLNNYEDVYNNRNWISYAISTNDDYRHGQPIMPPWPPDRDYSSLVGERSLTDEEINLFNQWVEEGGIQGDPSFEADLPIYPEGSAIGSPDIILEMEEAVQIQGNYQDYYRCFIFELDYEEDLLYSAIEVRPGNNEAVHHTIMVGVPPGSADYLDNQDNQYGYECFGGFGVTVTTELLGGYAPGTKPNKWPSGVAQSIPAGWDLVVQMHYAPVLEDMEDQSIINIFLADGEVDRVINSFTMIDTGIQLPPYQITEVYNSVYVSNDISILSFFPHSHLIGNSWEIFATTALNDTIPFIQINNWDFDWQNYYYPEYMLHIPSGSTIHAIATYDNTSNNPDNPNNPPQYVFWGDGTTDEMFFLPILYVDYQQGDEDISLGLDNSVVGDVNFDSSVDVIDVVLIVNFILDNSGLTNEQISLSDINNDGEIDILDVVSMVNIILDI